MHWTTRQLRQHEEAATRLAFVKDSTLRFLKHNKTATEYETQRFVVEQFQKKNLISDYRPPIVAFRQNTAHVHYMPSQYCLKLKPGSLILLDIWARVNEQGAPFADMTWMAFAGKQIPAEIKKVFEIVITARDLALQFVRRELRSRRLPAGQAIDAKARDYIARHGYGRQFLHTTGHILGFTSPHGNAAPLGPKTERPIMKCAGYTIEPGIYLKKRFGVRSEIDFYIDKAGTVAVTTPVQRRLVSL